MATNTQHKPVVRALTALLRKLALIGSACALITLLAAPDARAQSAEIGVANTSQPAEISREYLIKAAILYNFAKFASWPQTAFSYAGAPLRICVIGDDPFGAALDTLHGKQVRGRPLATTRITDMHDTPQCHILFVSASEEARLAQILDYVGQMPILTVADFSRFASAGGILALKEVDNRSRIEVNIGAADQAGLKLSSKLLRLADKADTPITTGDTSGSLDRDMSASATAAL